MSETTETPQRKEVYEPPAIEVVVLGSEDALLGVCLVEGAGCGVPFSTSGR